MSFKNIKHVCLLYVMYSYFPVSAQIIDSTDIQVIKQTSNSDISRIKTQTNQSIDKGMNDDAYYLNSQDYEASKVQNVLQADEVGFILRDIQITGGTVFSKNELALLYKKFINKNITLETIYKIAEKISAKYKKEGYFLSSAFVPEQNITDGIVKLHIIEGYIGAVELPKDDDIINDSVVQGYIQNIKQQKPVKADQIENFLLLLNDLAGYNISSTLSAPETGAEGALVLLLNVSPDEDEAKIGLDNSASRFLGTHQMFANYSTSFAPRHKTEISAIKSLAFSRLTHLNLSHEFTILPKITFDLTTSRTVSEPGLNLRELGLRSVSTFAGFGIGYKAIRQRDENLNFKASIDARNTNTDLEELDFVLIRDRIRALRFNANYNLVDNWNGATFVNTTVSQGISALGANKKNDDQISRDEARSNFKKIELSVTRIQTINDDFSFVTNVAGQLASDPLFSAEEFGYGGQSFGRAFDASELTGDHGLAASFELKYNGLHRKGIFAFQPYGFYDIGRLWNKDTAQPNRVSAASAGFGVLVSNNYGMFANLALAIPLVRSVQTPIYGQGDDDPRISFNVSQEF